MRRVVLLFLLVPGVLAVAGCGGAPTDNAADYSGARKDVAQAVDDIVEHAGKLEARDICDGFLTPQLKARLTTLAKRSGRGDDCANQLKESLRDADAFDLDVQTISVSGRTATVGVKVDTSAEAGKDPRGTLRMVEQRGWRIAQLP